MSNLQIISQIYNYAKHYKLQLFMVLGALIFSSSTILILGRVIGYIIDFGITQGNGAYLNRLILSIFIIVIIFGIASFIRSYSIYAVCEKIINNVRQDVYNHMINVNASFFETHKTSDIISRLTNDANLITNIISDTLSFALRNSIMTIGGIFMMITVSSKLALYSLIIIPFLVLPMVKFGQRVRAVSRDNQEKLSIISSNIEESFNAIKTLQTFNLQEFKSQKFASESEEVLDSILSRLRYRSLFFSIVIVIILSSVTAIIWIGSIDVISGQMSSGDLTSFIFFAVLTATSIGGVVQVFGEIQRAFAATERVLSLLDVKLESAGEDNNLTNGDIDFANISFAYPARPDIQILEGLNLTIQHGKFTGIVGRSGSGKSTLFQLLLKFNLLNVGHINLGDKNIEQISPKALREFFTIIPQDPFIFSDTAFANIAIGKINADKAEVIEAAKNAGIYDYLASLPEGLDSFLGEKGVRLSGGQRQRIAIARALLKKPEILLLDEATSALDSTNEKVVLDSVRRIMKGKTVISIAHRIATIENADEIIIMNKGKVEDKGSHKELLLSSELYRKLNYELSNDQ